MLLIIKQVIYVYGSLKLDVDLQQQYTRSTSHFFCAYGFHSYPKRIVRMSILDNLHVILYRPSIYLNTLKPAFEWFVIRVRIINSKEVRYSVSKTWILMFKVQRLRPIDEPIIFA